MSDCTVRPRLLPCPFCGGEAVVRKSHRWPDHAGSCGCDGYSVVCTNMDCVIYEADGYYADTEAEAIEVWNTRAERTCTNEWEQFGKFKCSNCSFEISYLSTYPPSPVPISYCYNCGAKVVDA